MHLAARGLSKSYDGRGVLKDVTLSFEPGSVNILLGPNGAGKTTLLRLLDLLEKPDRGEVLIDQRPLARVSFSEQKRARQRMGFVFQQPMVLDGTVFQNLATALKLHAKALDRPRLEACLDQVGLQDKISAQARTLSGGEKQRLQLARVLLIDPDVYLLDEPTASLDPLSARSVEGIIAGMAGSGKTVVLSTHNLLQARIIGQRFFFFSEGRLQQHGDGESLFSRPLTQDIAEYASNGNILDGHLVRHDQGCRFLSGPLSFEVTTRLPDGPAAILIRPEDILLSRDSLRSSARNSLPGTVLFCRDLGMVTAVEMDVSGVSLTAFVTRESLQNLGIQAGGRFWLTCKSTSIHVMAKTQA